MDRATGSVLEMADVGRERYQLGHGELVEQLRTQVGFIERSSAAYDDGYEDEARRLATVIRVLVHDTRNSTSLLMQLGVKDKLRYHDTTVRSRPGAIVLGSSGLALQRITTGPGGGGRYVPVGDDPNPDRIRPPVLFRDWWAESFKIANDEFTRKQLVLNVANQDGGAHVDPSLDPILSLIHISEPTRPY